MFFDIETSPNVVLSWRCGYNLTITPESILEERKIICISWKWEDEDEVYNLTWNKFQEDKKMLKEFIKEMNKADEVVAHNGDRFDIKWLRTRAIFYGLDMTPKIISVDTLKEVKKLFNFNSNRLDYIAKFLNVGGKIETGGYQLWKDVVLDNNRLSLKKMVEYCDNDVVILEKVYKKLLPYIEHKTHKAVVKGGEKFHCPECGNINTAYQRRRVLKSGVIKHWLKCSDKECGKYFSISNKTYQKMLEWKMLNRKK